MRIRSFAIGRDDCTETEDVRTLGGRCDSPRLRWIEIATAHLQVQLFMTKAEGEKLIRQIKWATADTDKEAEAYEN